MSLINRRNITVFDNEGKTFDRYTILNRKTGDVYGSSINPTHPQGFGLFNFNVADEYWIVAYGYSWRKNCDVKKCIKVSDLPNEVIKFIDETILK